MTMPPQRSNAPACRQDGLWRVQGNLAQCECCGIKFQPMRGSKSRFCSVSCHNVSQKSQRPFWFECSKCLAAIGLGMGYHAKVFVTSKTAIYRCWKKEGIRAQTPTGYDSWQHYAKSVFVSRWWGNSHKEWMSEYNPKFPDWSAMAGIKKLDIWIHKYLKDDNELRIRANIAKHKAAQSRRKSNKKRKINDPGFRVQCNLRHRLKEIMSKVKRGGTEHRNNLTGCTTRQLAKHLESTFKCGMTWNNYGTRWHVDHIIPCASFDHTDPKQRAQCWHWTNLRALDAKKNMDKSDTITEPQMMLLLCSNH
jgi:hypothetical protein